MPPPNLGIGFFIAFVVGGVSGSVAFSWISWVVFLILPFFGGYAAGLFTINKTHGTIIGGGGSSVGHLLGAIAVLVIFVIPENDKLLVPITTFELVTTVLVGTIIALFAGAFGGYIGTQENMKKYAQELGQQDSYYDRLYPDEERSEFLDYETTGPDRSNYDDRKPKRKRPKYRS